MKVAVRYSYEPRAFDEPDVAVFFDVFRASTAIATLLAQGPAELLTSADKDVALAKVAAGYRLISEVHAGGLDNSPTQIAATDLRGARVVHKSTNLTHAIFRNLGFRQGLIGSFANMTALVARVRALQPKSVELIAAGHIGTRTPATEDMAAAKHAAALLAGRDPGDTTDRAIIEAELARKVLPPDFGPHYWDDTKVALTLDAHPHVGLIVPAAENVLAIRKCSTVICAGDAGVDAYHLPDALVLRPGGCALNVAVNLKRAVAGAHDVAIVTTLGDDTDARVPRAVIEQHGLTRFAQTAVGRSPRQDIRIHPSGEKDFFAYEPGIVVSAPFSAAQTEALLAADWTTAVLYEQNEAWVKRLCALPRRGKLALDFMTMRDFGLDLVRVRPYYDRTDLAFFGLEPENGVLIDALERDARATGRTTIVTLGPAGSIIFVGRERIETPAPIAPKVVDTTGAGDNFLAAFIAATLNGANTRTAAVTAHAAATASVGRLGAFVS